MAKLDANFSFTGPLGNISAYRMRGIDRIILRKKGGASKRKIKTSRNFARTREANAEFGGRSIAGKWIRSALHYQKPMADYNISGPINALLVPIQEQDTVSPPGQRNIVLSKNPWLLQGFSLNRDTGFDSIVRNPLAWTLSRDTLSARIDIPALLPGINFFTAEKHPMYSIIATLGIVPDFFYNKWGYQPSSREYRQNDMQAADTGWYPVLKGSPAMKLEIQMGTMPPDQSFSLVLSIGIRFGALRDAGTIEQVKYAGAAKILAMG